MKKLLLIASMLWGFAMAQSCPAVTGITFTNVTSTSFSVTAIPGTGGINYVLYVNDSITFQQVYVSNPQGTPAWNVSGMQPNRTYNIAITKICTGFNSTTGDRVHTLSAPVANCVPTPYGNKAMSIKTISVTDDLWVPEGDTTMTCNPVGRSKGSLKFRTVDNTLWIYNGVAWQPVGSGGGLYSKVDSVTYNAGNLFYWVNGASTQVQGFTLANTDNLDSVLRRGNVTTRSAYFGDSVLVDGSLIAKVGMFSINLQTPNINTTGFYMPTSAGAGKVLTSDGIGTGTWQTPSIATPNPKTASRGVLLGNSTIAPYLSQEGIDFYLLSKADSIVGTKVKNDAVPGHTIAQQQAVFLADTGKANYDWIVVEVGLNDLDWTEAASVALGRYQTLIDSINANKKTTAKIVVASMTPCKQRLINVLGPTNGATAYQKWLDMNTAIMGGGANAITGVDYRTSIHTEALNDGTGNLALIYEIPGTVDGIHETNAARKIIAESYRQTLQKAGFMLPSGVKFVDPSYSNTNGISTATAQKVVMQATDVSGVATVGTRLGVGTTSPADLISVFGSGGVNSNRISITTTNAASDAQFSAQNNLGQFGIMFKAGSTYPTYKTLLKGDWGGYNEGDGNISFLNDYVSGKIILTAGGSSTPHLTVNADGSLTQLITSSIIRADAAGKLVAAIPGIDAIATGSFIASGNGVLTTFSIPHGLGVRPAWFNIFPVEMIDGLGTYLPSADATNIYITYSSARASGTNNLQFNYSYKK